ncbi:SPOSA6832_00750, partial [Sporobolomyces salmonicolor]
MAYIESELQKKRSGLDPSAPAASTSNKPYDPRDELYKVAEKYKFADVAAQEQGKKDKDDDEGNVTLSTSMLMGIPEVDLGIDTKLKNIEATEKAKRQLYDAQMAARKKAEEDKEEFAVDRFYRHQRPLESDADALAKARAAALNPAEAEVEEEHRRHRASGRRETATDDMAMERFKKRQRQNWGK